MESAEYLLKTITFSKKGLKLEEVIRLIYFDTKSFDFDEDLHSIITSLRKYSKYIKGIGYYDNIGDIRVKLLFNLNTIPLNEINISY